MTGNSIILATRGETAGENEGGHGRKGKRGDRGGTKGGALTRARTIDRVKPGRVLRKKDTVFRSPGILVALRSARVYIKCNRVQQVQADYEASRFRVFLAGEQSRLEIMP